MNRTQLLLFASTVFIWGSTWYAIKFQLGSWTPYFCGLAILCRQRSDFGLPTDRRFVTTDAGAAPVGGVTGDQSIRPELLSVLYRNGLSHDWVNCGVLFDHGDLEHLGAGLWFKSQVPIRVVVGACVGFCGVVLLFMPDVFDLTYGPAEIGAIFLCFLATLCASFGNLVNAETKSRHWSVAGERLGHAVWRDCDTGHGDWPR